jgi:hypothetical protein
MCGLLLVALRPLHLLDHEPSRLATQGEGLTKGRKVANRLA